MQKKKRVKPRCTYTQNYSTQSMYIHISAREKKTRGKKRHGARRWKTRFATRSSGVFLSRTGWQNGAGHRLGTGPLAMLSGINPVTPDVGVCAAGVGARLVTLLLLCAMCALTRWPAQSALFRLSSPANTPAAMTRASWRALSPGAVGCAPRTPRRSSMADWGSRMVPPPMVPTSIEGMETEIWRSPRTLKHC